MWNQSLIISMLQPAPKKIYWVKNLRMSDLAAVCYRLTA